MSQLQIRLLGQFQVILDGAVVSGFVSDKARALLAYLATEGRTPQRRETLANLLWSNMADTRARANFRRALSNLRKVIGDLQADPPFLQVTRHDITIHPESNAWVDVAVLSQAHRIEIPTSKTIPQFEAVLDLYKGKFLTGFNLPDSLPFDEWALIKREGYARMMDAILQRVGEYYEMKGDYDAALPFAWRHVELEPWQERARRQVMRLLVHTGRRDEALQQYDALEGELNAALNIKPSAKTRQLYDIIQVGKAIPLPERLLQPGLDEPSTLPAFLQETQVQAIVPRETFFARQYELDQLENALEAAITGRGCIIMVAGEAGSGKTMLVREFMQRAQSQYPELVSAAGYCNAFTGMGDPYLPFREILYQLSGDIEDRWKAGAYSRQMAVNLWHTVPITCQALLTYGPDLIDRLLPAQTLLAFTAPFAQTQPSWYRELVEHLSNKTQEAGSGIQQVSLFTQLSEVLQKISWQVPLLLFLDDLQWADAGTIGMLFQFLKHIEHSRILLVGAYRSEEVNLSQCDERHPLTPVLHEFQRQFGDVFINLDQSSGRDFIEGILKSEPNEMLKGFGEQLYRLTGGNALFTVEVLRSMRESGILIRDGRGVWVAKSELRLEKLPPRTEGVIAERVSRLPQNLQRILTLASVEGEVFTAEVIAGVAGLPIDEVISQLSDQLGKQHQLVRSQEISQHGKRTLSTYRIRHFLFQNYLYQRLDEIQRSQLHYQVGKELEKLAGENTAEVAVHLARHFHQANRVEKASIYYTLAGERAVGMSAYPEAVKHFEAALKMLLMLPENPDRNEQELDLQLQLGRAYQATMGYAHEKLGQAYQRAWTLCQSGGNLIKRITTIQLLTSYYMNIANFKTSELMMKYLEEVIEELEEVPPEFKLQPLLGYSYLYSLYGRHQAVVDHSEEAIKYYNQVVQHTSGERVGVEVGIFCHGWSGLHQNWLGYPQKAQAHILSIQKIAEGYHSKLFTRDALWFSAWISLEMGDIAAAREYTEALLALTIKEGYFFFEAAARGFLGRILSYGGYHQQAIESIQRGLDMFYQTGAVASQTNWLHDLAEAYCAAGQVEDGLAVIAKAEQVEQDTGEARHKSALERIKGDLYRLKGDDTAAEKAYRRAIAVARADGTKLLELEAVMRLACLWREQGKEKHGLEMLRAVYDWFTEGFNAPMLVEAKALMEDLAS